MAHRRRGVGVGRNAGAKYRKKADEMKAVSYQSAIDTIGKLETKLSKFSLQNQEEIQRDPALRQQFLQMCGLLGIDPLLSSKKTTFWGKIFQKTSSSSSSFNDFYYELAMKVAEVCLASRPRNGGIISTSEVQSILYTRYLKQQRQRKQQPQTNTKDMRKGSPSFNYSEEDIGIAIAKLNALGSGFRTIEIGTASSSSAKKTTMIISVPTELNNDHMELLSLAKSIYTQGITLENIEEATGWNNERTQHALQTLLQNGMAWLDIYKNEKYYWFPSIWQENNSSE